jgi:GntR family transcriptional regulator
LTPELGWCIVTPIQFAAMFFKLSQTTGQPLYLQLMQQIRHAVESGALRDGDQLPSIRSLAEELVVSPATVVKAYSELEREGIVDLLQGVGAFVSKGSSSSRAATNHVQAATRRVNALVEQLREKGLSNDEIRRIFEAALLHTSVPVEKL